MFLPEQLPALRRQIHDQAARDFRLLEDLVAQARELAPQVRTIRPRATTSVALTAADGGNNAVAFNPFSLQIIRVVDSAGKELFLDWRTRTRGSPTSTWRSSRTASSLPSGS